MFWTKVLAMRSFKSARPLNASEVKLFQPYFQANTLANARIVEGNVPFWLHKSMCAVVLYQHIFLRMEIDQPRTYQPNTLRGIELLAHELTHVEQYLSGLTLIKYLWASRSGYCKNPYEIEAYAKASVVREQFDNKKLLNSFF